MGTERVSGRERECFRQGQIGSVRIREGFREGFTGFSVGTEKFPVGRDIVPGRNI